MQGLAIWTEVRGGLTPLRVAIAAIVLVSIVLGVAIRVTAPGPAPDMTGTLAPAFALHTEQGGHDTGQVVTLAQQRGHPVLLVFTYSLCAHCLSEAETVSQVAAEYSPRGLRVLYIDSPAETPSIIAAYTQRLGITAPVLLDSGSAVAGRYHVGMYPGIALVDGGGRMRGLWTGETSAGVISSRVEPLLPSAHP
jgi:cytochrome c biogenesis protein CcmG/thiol:disulfide interchange protein DsbE